MKYLIWTKNWKSRYVAPNEVNTLEEWYTIETREVNPSEYEELGIPTFVSIKIPISLYKASAEIKEMVDDIVNFYSDTFRKKRDWIITISNINIKDVAEEIDKTQYLELKTAGVIFPEEVDDLFNEKEEDEETTTE